MAIWRPQDNRPLDDGEMTKRRDSANITRPNPPFHRYSPIHLEGPLTSHTSSKGPDTRQPVATPSYQILSDEEHVNSEVDREPEHVKVLARNVSCSSLSNAIGLRDKANSSVNVYGTRKTGISPFLRRQDGRRVRQHRQTPTHLRNTWYKIKSDEDGDGEEDNAATWERSSEMRSQILEMRWYKRQGADDDLAQHPTNCGTSGHDTMREMGR